MNRKRKLPDESESLAKKPKVALYLEDNTPITTLEVSNFDDNVDAGYLRGYFEGVAGPVSKVWFENRSVDGGPNSRFGYVTFVIPEDAAKLILEPNPSFHFKFTVKEAESVRQPKIDANALKFEDIYDDCLHKVASYLELIDIVNLGKTCTRLQSFVRLIYKNKTHFSFGMDTGDSFANLENVESVLEEMGSYIRSVEWKKIRPSQVGMLSEHCTDVTELKLIKPSGKLHLPDIRKNKHFFMNLEKLEIFGSSMYDSSMKVITSCSKIKSLHLEKCYNLRGKFLSKWKRSKLKFLKIKSQPWSVAFSVDDAFDYVRTNKLVKFSFDGYLNDKKDLYLPPECVVYLEELELSEMLLGNDAKLETLNFGDFERLTHFSLLSRPTFRNYNKILRALSQIPALESLTIENMQTDADTLNCLGSFKNIRRLRLMGLDNKILGRTFCSNLHVHLPEITELVISCELANPYPSAWASTSSGSVLDENWICEMVASLAALEYFHFASMTWPLLNAILEQRLRSKQPTIVIGVSKEFFADPEKVEFEAASAGIVKLKLCIQ